MLAVLARNAPILAAAMDADPASAERAVRVVFERGAGASGIEVRGRQGANGGRYLGIALAAWVVETKTGTEPRGRHNGRYTIIAGDTQSCQASTEGHSAHNGLHYRHVDAQQPAAGN
jgi:hypothetical protein